MGPSVPLKYEHGYFIYPRHFKLKANPSVGNVALLPERTEFMLNWARNDRHHTWFWRGVVNDFRGKHSHQDCQYLTAGSTIHMKAQVDEAGLCLADVHAYIGQGEVAFAGIEVHADVRVRVERSEGRTKTLLWWLLFRSTCSANNRGTHHARSAMA
jgi:acetamidase/formamidase